MSTQSIKPTTLQDIKPTTLDGIKSLATDIRKGENISHAEALDRAAQQAGYSNYQHARRTMETGSTRPAMGKPGYRVLIEVPWRTKEAKRLSWERIEANLPVQLDQILSFSQWKQAYGFYGMDLSRDKNRLTCQLLGPRTAEEALRNACTAARVLQFMAATGLRPSKARAKDAPRQARRLISYQDLRIPGHDHMSTWYDPVTKTYVALDEPYASSVEDMQEERAAWAKRHGWEVVKPNWAGMYAPDLGSEMYLLADPAKGFPMARVVKALEALPPAIEPDNCRRLEAAAAQ